MSLEPGERVLLEGHCLLLGDADDAVGEGALCVTTMYLYFAPAATTGTMLPPPTATADGEEDAAPPQPRPPVRGNLVAPGRTMFRVPFEMVMLHAKMPADLGCNVPSLYCQIDPSYAMSLPASERLAAATGDDGCALLAQTNELRVVPNDELSLAVLWDAFSEAQAASSDAPDEAGASMLLGLSGATAAAAATGADDGPECDDDAAPTVARRPVKRDRPFDGDHERGLT